MEENTNNSTAISTNVLLQKKPLIPGDDKEDNTIENKSGPEVIKEEIEEEVKESFQDEDVPVEPAVGNDGIEVGGEG